MRVFGRYLLFQLPEWTVVAGVSWGAVMWWELAPWVMWAVGGSVVAKDLALFPWLRAAYDDQALGLVGPDALIGAEGRVEQALVPHGRIKIGSERWRAVAINESAPLEVGCIVRVRAVRGLELSVEPLPNP